MEFRGARYLHVFVPCPLGWGSASRDTIRIARLAKETGLFPVFEAEHGEVVARLEDPPPRPGRGVPAAAAALRPPVRRPAAHRRDRADPGERRPQHRALRAARGHGGRRDARSRSRSRSTSARASPTRPAAGAPSAPVYVDRLPPCNHACPAGENIQQWLYEAEEGGAGYERAWRADHGGQPVPGDHGPGLLPPVRDRLQPRPARRGGRHQLGRALPRRRGDQAGLDGRAVDAPPTGKRVLVVGAGPSGLSAAYHLARLGHEVTIHDAGPMAGGMMRFGIPKYRLPRDVLDAEVAADPRPGRRRSSSNRKVDRRARRDAARAASTPPSSPSAPTSASAPTSPPARPRASSTPSRCCAAWRARSSRCSAGASSSTAAATPRWTRPAPPSGSAPTEAIVVYRRTRDRMPAHDFEVEEAEEEGVLMKWLSTIKQADEGKLVLEKMELDETGFPQPTGELEELEADSLVLALGQETDLSLLDGVPGIEVEDGVVAGRPEHDDRPPGDLRRRRHGARRAHGDRRRSATARRPPATSTPGCAAARYEPPPKHELADLRHAEHLVLRGRAAHRAAAARAARRRSRRSTRSSAGSTSRTRCSRRAAACRAATASPATTATASAPTTPCSSSAQPGERVRDRPRLLQGLRHLRRRSARAARSRWCPRRSEP